MSASAMVDGVVAILANASPFGTAQVSKNDYGVIETAACAIIVQSIRNRSVPQSYGEERRQNRTIFLDMWLKETGDPVTDLSNLLSFQDNVEYVLNANPTLNGTAENMGEYRIERDPETVWQYGGQQWFRLFGEIEAWELV